jgi:hypothetical protein
VRPISHEEYDGNIIDTYERSEEFNSIQGR